MSFSGQLFLVFVKFDFYIDVAMCYLVHNVDTINCLCKLLTASGIFFMSDARETQASLILQERFLDV